MSNDHRDLHTLCTLCCPRIMPDWEVYEQRYGRPMREMQLSTASREQVHLGDQAQRDHNRLLAKMLVVYVCARNRCGLY
jgi:hypothetical protein